MTLNDQELTRLTIEGRSLLGQISNHIRANDKARLEDAWAALKRVAGMGEERTKELNA